MTEVLDPNTRTDESHPTSLSTAAARNLATTTKSVPQMRNITSRWLLRILPWVQASGGAYRVNRRLAYTVGDGRVTFLHSGSEVRVIPAELGELPLLRGFDDPDALAALADRFEQREYQTGDVLVEFGHSADQVVLVAHGKLSKIGAGQYGDQTNLGTLADGDYFGSQALTDENNIWEFTAKALTPTMVLTLSRQRFQEVVDQSETLRHHVEQAQTAEGPSTNPHGEAAIDLAAGHAGEAELPNTYVDYETSPREYELSVAQTVLRVHSRVADLYNEPMNQVEQQLRLTIEALRERQEHEIINNADFGLLNNADFSQCIHARSGPPTPDDMDDLLALVWKDPGYILAHPKAIAAFGKECNRRGIYPQNVELNGHMVPAWRGIPVLPCNKIPISDTNTTSILALRTGESKQGVIGLHQTGIPDEYQPGLSVRFMNVDDRAVISYLVSAYYSAAILVPDALGVLETVQIGLSDD